MKRLSHIAIASLGLMSPLAADEIPPVLDSALATFGSSTTQRWTGRADQKSASQGSTTIVMNGSIAGHPFQGPVEVVQEASRILVLSQDALPGFALLGTEARTVKLAAYEDRPFDISDLAQDIRALLNVRAIRKIDGDWKVESDGDAQRFSVVLPASVRPTPAAKPSRGTMLAVPSPRVLESRVEFRLDGTGRLLSLQIEVDRASGFSAMIGMGNGQSRRPRADKTQVVTLEPSADPISTRGNLVKAQLAAALASPPANRVGGATPSVSKKPNPTPVPASSRERLSKIIDRYDLDKDGKLSAKEAGARWEKLAKHDQNKDRAVSLEELIVGYQRAQEARRANPPRPKDD